MQEKQRPSEWINEQINLISFFLIVPLTHIFVLWTGIVFFYFVTFLYIDCSREFSHRELKTKQNKIKNIRGAYQFIVIIY